MSIFSTMKNNWWTRLRVRIAWGIRRPGTLEYLERSVKGDRDAGKTFRNPFERRKCLCGKHPYNVICGSELLYQAFAAGVYEIIKEPWFLTTTNPEGPEVEWTPRDSQQWFIGQEVKLPRVILGPIEGAFIGFLADQWQYTFQTLTDEDTGAFFDTQRFIRNNAGNFKGTAEPGEAYYFGYDWADPALCRRELLALGFQPADLIP